ncbi:serine/threonine protein kinase [Bradymonas sediminis]|uniref:non-specific serine/threonine protein kinase n=1 Tax=Bradymonas sediminis TaxID=1548548 RepID=A0A2Z4FQ47_9DELT|nr:serine/threonine-protein kinase [Bradymonas sediminis]AWV90754.1 serine/threonine protein kinase [Bradymonas sediminis]TDP62603.1 serine/threonine protein kinase [Bradymonas sediminis]
MSINTQPEQGLAGPVDLIGQRLFGGYEVIKKLGEGGMGAVYLAQQASIGQSIALKVLRSRATRSDETVARFHREAKVIGMMTHPNIVRVLIFGRLEGLLYMAMEYVHGDELQERMQRGLLSEVQVIKIMKQTLSALAEAHDLGVIHRDLKPENILLTNFRGEPDFVKVLDFGIAKILEDNEYGETNTIDEMPLTQTGIVYGTPYYLSPEQARADELDTRTDIYSLGCILYELMAGQKPFDGKSAAEVVRMQAFEQPRPAREVAPDRVSPTMAGIIEKAMSKDREDRFSSAMEMFDALMVREQELLQEGVITGRSTYFPGSEVTGSRPLMAIDAQQPGLYTPPTSPDEGGPTVTLKRRSVLLIVAGVSFAFMLMTAMLFLAVATR